MMKKDSRLVMFARKASTIQKTVLRNSTEREQLMVFNTAFESIKNHQRYNVEDDRALVNLIMGSLEVKLAPARGLTDDSVFDKYLELAQMFVKDVWHGILKRKLPEHRDLSAMREIYRIEMIRAQTDEHLSAS